MNNDFLNAMNSAAKGLGIRQVPSTMAPNIKLSVPQKSESTPIAQPAQTAQPMQQQTISADQKSGEVNGALMPAEVGKDTPMDSLGKGIANTPSSAVNMVKNVFSMLRHPVDTVTGLGDVLAGGVETGINKVAGKDVYDTESTSKFSALADALKERYGSTENLQRTAVNDPMGFGSDILSLITGGQALLQKAGVISKTSTVENLVGKASDAVSKVKESIPLVRDIKMPNVTAPFAGSVDTEVASIADKYGVPLPAASKSTSPIVQQAEAISSKGFGGGKIVDKIQQSADKIKGIADSLTGGISGAEDLSNVGRDVAKGMEKYTKSFKETTGALFDSFMNEAGDIPTAAGTTQKAIQEIVTQKMNSLSPDMEEINKFNKILANIKSGEGRINFSTLKNTRTDIAEDLFGNKTRPAIISRDDAALTRVYDSLSKDMVGTMKAIGRDDLAKMYEDTNKLYSEGITKLNSAYGQKIKDFSDAGQFDKIVPALFNAKTSIDDIPRIYEIVGKDNIPKIQQSVVSELFAKSKNTAGEFTPGGIGKYIKSYGEDKLSAILTPEQFQTLKDIDALNQALGKGKAIVSGSQTAFLSKQVAETGAMFAAVSDLFSGNYAGFVAKLSPILGSVALQKLVASPFGQKLLTTGFPGISEKALQKMTEYVGDVQKAQPATRLKSMVDSSENQNPTGTEQQ